MNAAKAMSGAQQAAGAPKIVNPPALSDPTPYGYSHATVVTSGSPLAFISGQIGADASGALAPSFEEQVEQAYRNLRTVLDALGAEPAQIAKLTTYVVDHDESKIEVLTRCVKGLCGDSPPAQTLVPVSRLALDAMLFEVDAVVVLS